MTYSRAKLIAFYSAMPPESKPCTDERCPIAVAFDVPAKWPRNHNEMARLLDTEFADAVDRFCTSEWLGRPHWKGLTAARIVKIAKGLKKEKEGSSV